MDVNEVRVMELESGASKGVADGEVRLFVKARNLSETERLKGELVFDFSFTHSQSADPWDFAMARSMPIRTEEDFIVECSNIADVLESVLSAPSSASIYCTAGADSSSFTCTF